MGFHEHDVKFVRDLRCRKSKYLLYYFSDFETISRFALQKKFSVTVKIPVATPVARRYVQTILLIFKFQKLSHMVKI